MNDDEAERATLQGDWEWMKRALHVSQARVRALEEALRIFIHAHQTGNSVPPHIEEQARAALGTSDAPGEAGPCCCDLFDGRLCKRVRGHAGDHRAELVTWRNRVPATPDAKDETP